MGNDTVDFDPSDPFNEQPSDSQIKQLVRLSIYQKVFDQRAVEILNDRLEALDQEIQCSQPSPGEIASIKQSAEQYINHHIDNMIRRAVAKMQNDIRNTLDNDRNLTEIVDTLNRCRQ